MKRFKQYIPPLITLAVLAAANSLLFSSSNTVMADIFLVYAIAIWVLALMLRSSMADTLYSYKNILLVGGMLFLFVLATEQAVTFISFARAGELSLSEMYAEFLSFPRRFSYYALFLIIAVSILVGISNVFLIKHEGFCLNNALSLVVAGFYIGGAVIVYFISDRLSSSTELPRLSIVLRTVIPLFLMLMLCYFECVGFGCCFMGWKAARSVPAHDKDFIIILGCSIDKRGGLLPLLKGRVNRAIRFAWEQEIETGKPLRYVPSGGQGANEVMSEGSAMELYLLSRGAESYEVFPEKKSTNTLENMQFSKKIIDGIKPDAKVAFATTNYHILRSGIIARRAGLDADGIAGDTKWYFWPNGFVREFFGILAMNIRTHVYVGIAVAIVCSVVGIIEYNL